MFVHVTQTKIKCAMIEMPAETSKSPG